MNRKIAVSVFAILALACLALGADKAWTGVISDSHCGLKHSTASDEAAACVKSCVTGGAKYVLAADGKLYQLEPQDKIDAKLAGRDAKITGTLSGDTITVTSAVAAPAKKKGAGS
jgi:hypothetical protein